MVGAEQIDEAIAAAAVSSWVVLVVLAVTPGTAFPRTGWRGNMERALLYCIVAAITRAMITEHRTRWQLLALSISAILFETVRSRVSGRSNGVEGWLSSTLGAGLGAILLRKFAHAYFWRWGI